MRSRQSLTRLDPFRFLSSRVLFPSVAFGCAAITLAFFPSSNSFCFVLLFKDLEQRRRNATSFVSACGEAFAFKRPPVDQFDNSERGPAALRNFLSGAICERLRIGIAAIEPSLSFIDHRLW